MNSDGASSGTVLGCSRERGDGIKLMGVARLIAANFMVRPCLEAPQKSGGITGRVQATRPYRGSSQGWSRNVMLLAHRCVEGTHSCARCVIWRGLCVINYGVFGYSAGGPYHMDMDMCIITPATVYVQQSGPLGHHGARKESTKVTSAVIHR